jgi:hypothetical protein
MQWSEVLQPFLEQSNIDEWKKSLNRSSFLINGLSLCHRAPSAGWLNNPSFTKAEELGVNAPAATIEQLLFPRPPPLLKHGGSRSGKKQGKQVNANQSRDTVSSSKPVAVSTPCGSVYNVDLLLPLSPPVDATERKLPNCEFVSSLAANFSGHNVYGA